MSWVERLFSRFTAVYGATAVHAQYRGVDMAEIKSVWAEELAKLTTDEIKVGVSRLTGLKYPPNVAEFMTLCRPPPDYQELYVQASMGEFKTVAAFEAAKRFGIPELRTQTWAQASKRWTAILDDEFEKYGDTPRNSPPSLEMKDPQPVSAAERDEIRERLQAVLAKVKTAVPGLHWAKTLLQAAHAGAPLDQCQIDMIAVALKIDPKDIPRHPKPRKWPEYIACPEHLRCCAVGKHGRCTKPGSRTDSTSGSERWYCSEHAR